MRNTALPRSLDPAPGELLPGYLLRLAHRVGKAPLDLAHRCGLTAGTTFPTHHLVRLDDNRARQTATVCRLSLREVHALTLATQAPSYPPLHPVYLGRHQSHIDVANDGWVFTAFSRYCPDCLADTADRPGGAGLAGLVAAPAHLPLPPSPQSSRLAVPHMPGTRRLLQRLPHRRKMATHPAHPVSPQPPPPGGMPPPPRDRSGPGMRPPARPSVRHQRRPDRGDDARPTATVRGGQLRSRARGRKPGPANLTPAVPQRRPSHHPRHLQHLAGHCGSPHQRRTPGRGRCPRQNPEPSTCRTSRTPRRRLAGSHR
ncbi:TniQ family protein [Streptomyces sp. NPDC005262]|uniref:TniQ family protein n=1 Tax=Streptomyces sp. NPDC005262 TaxID=3364710 RepID=UPI0036B87985